MSIQRNDWSLQRKGIIDQERHKDRVKEHPADALKHQQALQQSQ